MVALAEACPHDKEKGNKRYNEVGRHVALSGSILFIKTTPKLLYSKNHSLGFYK